MRTLGPALVASALVVTGIHPAAKAAPDDGQPIPARILVRLEPSLAREAETTLLGVPGPLSPAAAPRRIQAFLEQYAVSTLRPVHEERVREKTRRAVTEPSLATSVRRRFSARGRRWRAPFRPPDLSRTYVLQREVSSRDRIPDLLAEIARDPRVEHVEEDRVVQAGFVPDDPYFSTTGTWGQAYDDLYGLKKIGAPSAWDTTAGEGSLVAIVDTGLDYTHPDIAGNVWTNPGEMPDNGVDDDGNGYVDDTRGWDFVGARYFQPTPDNDPRDGWGHGTHVAGTVAALGNNGVGVVGVAWRAKVMAVKGLDDRGTGYDSQLASAIVYAADNGADVINASWGGPGTSETLRDAVDYAVSLGVVFVAAAGNSADDVLKYRPASLGNVITVAATDASDQPAYFTNWGSRIDVAAPGVDILSLRAAGTSLGPVVGDAYVRLSGTSMAAPHVSGLVALVLALHPDLSTEQVRQVVRASADDATAGGVDLDTGHGRVNAAAAVAVGPPLEALILEPGHGTRVGGTTPVLGRARGPGFTRYELSFGAGETPGAWTTIREGFGAVDGGELGVFDAGALTDGLYALRLRAFDGAGRAFEDRVPIVVDYTAITSPIPPIRPPASAVFKPGAAVLVEGRATGASFQGFRVEWARGINPAEGWSAAGVVLEGGGQSAIFAGPLASWDTTGITAADYYTIRVLVLNSGFTSEARTLVYLEPDLLTGHWPRFMSPEAWPGTAALPARDGTGARGLVIPSVAGPQGSRKLMWFSADGATVTTTPLGQIGFFQPPVADVDGAPGDEVIVSESDGLRIVHPDGTSDHCPLPSGTAPIASPLVVVEDVDGDGTPEIFAVGTDSAAGTGQLLAWRHDGVPLGGDFPVAIPDQNPSLLEGHPRLLVADLEGDGSREIVLAYGSTPTTFSLRILAADATPRPVSAPLFDGNFGSLAAADLDGDGVLEILVVAVTGGNAVLHVLRPDGAPKSGWPYAFPYLGPATLAIADLDRDGNNEVIATNAGRVLILRADGTPFPAWPGWSGGYGEMSALAGDLDGDGYPEILVSTVHYTELPGPLFSLGGHGRAETLGGPIDALARGSRFYSDFRLIALRPDGTIAKSWRLQGVNGQAIVSLPQPVIADVDGDGRTDIALVYEVADDSFSTYANAVTVLTTGGLYRPGASEWPFRNHDGRNTAVLPRDTVAPSVTITAPATGALVAVPVTVKADAEDNGVVKGVQFEVDGVDLGPEDTAPPFEALFEPRLWGLGPHELTAVARDAAGNRSTSAPVPIIVDDDRSEPTVALTFPGAGALLSAPVTVTADASDDWGVVRVELYVDGELAGTDFQAPYTFAWDVRAAGEGGHSLLVKAYDAEGNLGASASVPVTVEIPPVATIIFPASGAKLTGIAAAVVEASDNTAVVRVELDLDGLPIGTDTTAPWFITWDTVPIRDGSHSLLARAYDARGRVGRSTPVPVTIANPPAVSITSPAPGDVPYGVVPVSAVASDVDGVARVDLLVDGYSKAVDVEAPYVFDWDSTTVSEGSHTLAAMARDVNGNIAVSAAVTVKVGLPPVASIASPSAGAVLSGTAMVTVDATDNVGVTRVELYVDGTLAGTDTLAPWAFALETWARADGPHTLEARAYDAAGKVGSSGPRAVTTDNRLAAYDAALKVPVCSTLGAACDSGLLLNGRGTVGPEPNRPNTLGGTCADSSAGAYHVNESNDRIRVSTLDASNLTAGRSVKVEATVWAHSAYTSDRLDLYYASNATSPTWTLIGTFTPPGSGVRTMSTTFVLSAGSLQAVRARFRLGGSASPCGTGSYYDHDDLAFAVEPNPDQVPPTSSITSPTPGAVVSGLVAVAAEATDDSGVARVDFLVDGTARATDTAAPFTFAWDTDGESRGSHTLQVRAQDAAGNAGLSAPVTVEVQTPPGVAFYDLVLRAPRCDTVAGACDSGTLLLGRGTKGPEPNAPNTLGASCADGTSGTFHSDESNDRIRVATLDGTSLAAGKVVTIEATVWAYSAYSLDRLDLYRAADATAPAWTLVATLTPTRAGAQVLSATYTLPAGSLQAVRARFRYGGSAAPCGTGSYNDHDDLVFRVE